MGPTRPEDSARRKYVPSGAGTRNLALISAVSACSHDSLGRFHSLCACQNVTRKPGVRSVLSLNHLDGLLDMHDPHTILLLP